MDCALHAPSRDGDDRNFHAHLLLTACTVDADGVLGKKAERLDPIGCKRSGAADSVSWLRPRWEHSVNAALARKGSAERVSHRSFKARGIDRLPTVHTGIKGAAARGRSSLNARLRHRNARVADIDEQTAKLMRMKARLAARAEPKPDTQRPVDVNDRASDLLVWRRCPQSTMPKGAVLERMAKSEGPQADSQPDAQEKGSRQARRRPGG